MENIMIESLVEKVEKYDETAGDVIRNAYEYAYKVHGNQRRKNGELYIHHPLAVALILADLKADRDTICAGLLHDVMEDGDGIQKEDIEEKFNPTIAILTDGVTKMSLDLFSNKREQNNANYRKLIMGVVSDPRIILLKLADRLHNMRTLKYLSRNKQIENAIETLEFYVPLANYYGFHWMKSELEELAFQYLNYDLYCWIQAERCSMMAEDDQLKHMANAIHDDLIKENIDSQISYRFKRPYAIFQQLTGRAIQPSELVYLQKEDLLAPQFEVMQIHDLRALKILVSSLEDCYLTQQYLIHHFLLMDGKKKDCIKNPKTNGYRSLHTTIYGSDCKPVQTQIRTQQMDQFDSLGLASYWEIYGKEAYLKMREELSMKFPFYQSLLELNQAFSKNEEFVWHVKKELFSNMIYPQTPEGQTIELPLGATPVDFAFKTHCNVTQGSMVAFVDGKPVPLNYPLPNKAIVEIVPTLSQYVAESLSSYAVTTYAKRKIRGASR